MIIPPPLKRGLRTDPITDLLKIIIIKSMDPIIMANTYKYF